MKKISTKNAIIILVVSAVFGLSVVFILAGKQKEINYKTFTVETGGIIQTVSETGTVKASTEIDLGFLNTGKIQRLNFKVGDYILEGQLLAELDYKSLVISKQEAQANYDVAVQTLNKLLAGATNEEKLVAEATVRQAETANESAESEMSRVRSSSAENIAQAEKSLYDLESDSKETLTTYEQAIATAATSLGNTITTSQQFIDNYRDSALVIIDDKISSANIALDAVNRVLTDEDAENFLSVQNNSYLSLALSAYRDGQEQKIITGSSLTTAKISLSQSSVNSALVNAIYLLDISLTALENTFSALENSITGSSFTQADIDSHKNTISTHLITINTAVSLLKGAEQNYKNAILAYDTGVKSAEDALAQAKSSYSNAVLNAQNALNTSKASAEQQITSAQSKVNATAEGVLVAEAQRERTLATASSYDITLARARIRQAQASLDSVSDKIDNSQIKAPINGLITSVDYNIGEQFVPGRPAITLLGEGDYEIEVLISEADISKVKIGDFSEITLDAFSDENIFNGSIVFVEPAETIIQDVIYYLVTIKFDPKEEKIKSGMTANIVITTNQKSDIIAIPSRSITDRGDGKFVQLLVAEQVKEQKIITGIRGDGGNVEIIDGLHPGDVIITQIIEN